MSAVLPELSSTVYERGAHREEAPVKTDCLTSIHYLFAKALGIEIPITFVGDMPRHLASLGWKFEIVDIAAIRSGDLLFLKHKARSRLIVHVALALRVDRIFHCREAGMCVEPPESLFETYEQEIKRDLLRYIDFRNEKLREESGGAFLKGESS